MADIIVFAEVDDGAVNDISLQCLAKARQVAGAGGRVKCLAAGPGAAGAAPALFGCGADEVSAADDPRLAGYAARRYGRVVGGWLKGQGAALALFPSTTLGCDLAASVAAERGTACVLYCDDVAAADGGFVFLRAEYDRKVTTHYALAAGGLAIASLRDGAAAAPRSDASRAGAVSAVEVVLDEADLVTKVLRRDVAKKTVNLKEAKIIVSGGAGVGSAGNFALIRELAAALGAEVGATRAVVDAGWLPADHQVGQTGATVRPSLYIACGISGAVQHRVGMMDSGRIVAINTDANAPIFRIAHYKIVGDLKVVVPKLVKLLRN